jgi:hypothetical protein
MERRIVQYEKPFSRCKRLMPALSLVFARLMFVVCSPTLKLSIAPKAQAGGKRWRFTGVRQIEKTKSSVGTQATARFIQMKLAVIGVEIY